MFCRNAISSTPKIEEIDQESESSPNPSASAGGTSKESDRKSVIKPIELELCRKQEEANETELIEEDVERMNEKEIGPLLREETVNEDQGQCSDRASVEFVGIQTELKSKGIERMKTQSGIRTESDKTRRGNGKDTVSGSGPSENAMISRTSTVYVCSLSPSAVDEL